MNHRLFTIIATALLAGLDAAQQVLPAVQAFIPTPALAWANAGLLIGLAVLHAVVKQEAADPPPATPAQPPENQP